MDELNGAIGRRQLQLVQNWNEARASAAAKYTERLDAIEEVVTPTVAAGATHVYHLYVIQVPDRDTLRENLDAAGIDTGIHYPTPAHRHPAIRERTGDVHLEVTERLTDRILSLPMHPRITDEDLEYVCEAIERHYE
jgi:dTDP-4-amino-4,6-dideoxygalactose transaminase